MRLILVCCICCISALIPFVSRSERTLSRHTNFPGWPKTFEGRSLTPIGLSEREQGFAQDFPGEIERFSDGEREIIIRYVRYASRRVHPAADCMRGSSYTTTPLPIRVDQERNFWGCVQAERDRRKLRICERLYDSQGDSWYDTSSWYWAAVLGKSSGPWWAVTLAERIE